MRGGDDQAEAVEAVEDLAHDLGKYIHMSARMLPADAPLSAVWEALREDLLETRRGPDGHQRAAALYAARRAALPSRLLAEPLVVALDAHLSVISANEGALLGPPDAVMASRLRAAAQGAQAACRALRAAARTWGDADG